jgi:hypothetical protein
VSPTGTGLYTGTATGTGQYGTDTRTGTGQYAGTGETAPLTTPPVGPGSFEEGR